MTSWKAINDRFTQLKLASEAISTRNELYANISAKCSVLYYLLNSRFEFNGDLSKIIEDLDVLEKNIAIAVLMN